MTKILEVGEKAPDFSIPDQNGKVIELNDIHGKWTVVYFYPKDDTPGCTVEAKEFTDLSKDFGSKGATIYGVSPDNEAKHCKFIDKHGLSVELLADTEKTMLADYGVWQEKQMYGKTYMGTSRSTFVIDSDGVLKWVGYGVRAKGHVDKIMTDLGIE